MSDIDKAINLAEAKLKLNELNYSDRLRLLAQGALMNFSDEFFAMIRSIGTETYEEAVADEREELKKAQAKEGSLKYEIGGAMAPALALAPFTGGASIPATVGRYAIGTGGRLMTQGAIQGGTSAVGRQEGDIVSRITENPLDIGVSTATGTLLNPAVQKVGGKIVEGVTKIAEPLIRKIKGQLGKPVEDELARIAKESGKEIDEIIEEIALGKTIPELSETSAAAVRGFYSKAGPAKPTIADSLVSRKEQKVTDVFATLQRDLSPNEKIGNVLKFIRGSEKELQRAASRNYEEIYKNFQGFRSNNLNLAVEEALQRQPMLRGKIRTLMTGLGKGVPFEIKDGVLKLTQDIDLRTAEKIRGLLFDRTNQLFKRGDGELGIVSSDLEKSLRGIIDETSPDLSMARATWSKLKDAQSAFKDGQSIFTKNADEAELMFDKLVAKGDLDAVESFRAGVASAIRGKKQSRVGISFINNLGDLNKKESLILQKIYPDEVLDNVVDKINLAKASIMAQGRIMGGSQTAETIGAASRVGTVDDAYALTRVLASGGTDIGAGVQLLKKFIPTKSNALNDNQMLQVAELLISENKQLLRNALTNNEARNALMKTINDIADRLIAGGAAASVQQASNLVEDVGSIVSPAISAELNPNMDNMGLETDAEVQEAISPLIATLDTDTRQKIIKIYADGTVGQIFEDTREEVPGTRYRPR